MNLPATITLNSTTYNTAELSEVAKANLFNLLITNEHIERLEQQLAIAKTAKNAYQAALFSAVAEVAEAPKKKITRSRKAKADTAQA